MLLSKHGRGTGVRSLHLLIAAEVHLILVDYAYSTSRWGKMVTNVGAFAFLQCN